MTVQFSHSSEETKLPTMVWCNFFDNCWGESIRSSWSSKALSKNMENNAPEGVYILANDPGTETPAKPSCTQLRRDINLDRLKTLSKQADCNRKVFTHHHQQDIRTHTSQNRTRSCLAILRGDLSPPWGATTSLARYVQIATSNRETRQTSDATEPSDAPTVLLSVILQSAPTPNFVVYVSTMTAVVFISTGKKIMAQLVSMSRPMAVAFHLRPTLALRQRTIALHTGPHRGEHHMSRAVAHCRVDPRHSAPCLVVQ